MSRVVVVVLALAACGRVGFSSFDADTDAEPPCMPEVDVAALDIGNGFACARLGDGTARCWGAGNIGQLGDGTRTTRPLAVEVSGLSGVTALAAGRDHVCALASARVYCWGRNDTSQLGINALGSRMTPTEVTGLPADVVGVAAGGLTGCAWTAGGELWCWGQRNGSGNSDQPVRIANPSGVTHVALSTSGRRGSVTHGCVTTGIETWCWGVNTFGVLGEGSFTSSPTPVRVQTTMTFVELAAGDLHSCGRTQDGRVACWGLNADGQLGDGTVAVQSVPVMVPIDEVVELAAGGEQTCARRGDGTVWCWGDNDELQLGRAGVDALVPELVASSARSLAVGTSNACAVGVDGVLRCWGSDRTGLISGDLDVTANPVVELASAIDIDAGGDTTCAVLAGGDVRCWGAAAVGQLGDGGVAPAASTPVVVPLDEPATSVSVGLAHTCTRHASGRVSCWGDNEARKVTGTTELGLFTPRLVGGVGIVAAGIVAGSGHTCAWPLVGAPWCWGHDSEGALGFPQAAMNDHPPTASLFPTSVTAMTGGHGHTCAVLGDGRLFCSGRDNEGQIGSAVNTGDVYTPLEVTGAPSVVTASAAFGFTCASSTNLGQTWCWGDNADLQLGDGTDTSVDVPISLAVGGFVELVSGATHTCGRDAGGSVWCWGSNSAGQLGDRTLRTTGTPVVAVELAGAVQLAAGDGHTCARFADGTVRCVGASASGQRGDGGVVRGPAPLQSLLTCPARGR